MKPKRIQRKRAKGWKKPPNTVNVTRPGRWGNPFQVLFEAGYWVVRDQEGGYWSRLLGSKGAAVERSVEVYREWLQKEVSAGRFNMDELKGKKLMCWCASDDPCHADVLLEIANS